MKGIIKTFNEQNFYNIIRKIGHILNMPVINPKEKASYVYQRLYNYLLKFDGNPVNSFIIENDYIDRDFLIDFSIFYARSFKYIPKNCIRLHFLSIKKSDLEKIFSDLFQNAKEKKYLIQFLQENYIGSIVLKPLSSPSTIGRVGKTLFKTYSEIDRKGNKRIFVKTKNTLNLFGIDVTINSLPFQEQDQAVAACATVALWTELIALKELFESGFLLSPGEITNRTFATVPFTFGRKFPNEGLSIYQLISFFRDLGYEVSVYDAQKLNSSFIKQLIYAYIKFNLPLIVTIEGGVFGYREIEFDTINSGEKVKLKEKIKYPIITHAAVISGIKLKKDMFNFESISDAIETLFVHDDQIGPYSKVEFENSNILKWKNEWIDKIKNKSYANAEEIFLNIREIIVPIYSKIRLKLVKVYREMERLKEVLRNYSKKDFFSFELYLSTLRDFKKEILFSNLIPFKKKQEILLKNLPRFLWIIKIYKNKNIYLQFIYDATDHNIEDPIVVINYSF